jgi:hypothetical protein
VASRGCAAAAVEQSNSSANRAIVAARDRSKKSRALLRLLHGRPRTIAGEVK